MNLTLLMIEMSTTGEVELTVKAGTWLCKAYVAEHWTVNSDWCGTANEAVAACYLQWVKSPRRDAA